MNFEIDPFLVAGLLIGGACGLESWLAGRKVAIATHIVATCLGYSAVAISNGPIAVSFGVGATPMYVMAVAFLLCGWIAESDSLRARETVDNRGDASNYVTAFVIGFACAMGSILILICAAAEMFALYMRRARAGCEPVYGGETLTAGAE